MMISIPCLNIAADLDCSQNSGSRTGISFISFFFSNNEALNADQEISELVRFRSITFVFPYHSKFVRFMI